MSETGHTQVLRFALGENDYSLPIDYVSEIVDGEDIQSVPDSDPHARE